MKSNPLIDFEYRFYYLIVKNLFIKGNPEVLVFILITFLVGVQNIDMQLVDDHSWRQSLTNIVSKNLLTHPNLLYPRTIFCCKGDYILGGEFPFFNAIIAMLYTIFGYEHWYGRLLNLIVTSAGVVFFYDILKKLFNKEIALYSSIIFMSSIAFQFARKIMPDTFSLSLGFISIWFLLRYIQTIRFIYLIPGLVLLALAGLSKFPSYCVIAFLAMPVWEKGWDKSILRGGGGGVILVSLFVAAWYLYWVPYLVDTYGNQLLWPVSYQEGFLQIIEDSQKAWYRFEINAFSNRIPFFIGIMGLGVSLYRNDKRVLYIFGVYTMLFLGFIGKAGGVFSFHNYYIIPYLPMLSLLFGYGIFYLVTKKIVALVLVNILFYFGVEDNYQKSKPLDELKAYPRLGALVNRFCGKYDKVMINLGQFNPTGLYFADRYGWSENNEILTKKEWMPDFKKDGLKIIIVDKAKFPNADLDYKKVYEDADFVFYEP